MVAVFRSLHRKASEAQSAEKLQIQSSKPREHPIPNIQKALAPEHWILDLGSWILEL
jgi:hypothetical protein